MSQTTGWMLNIQHTLCFLNDIIPSFIKQGTSPEKLQLEHSSWTWWDDRRDEKRVWKYNKIVAPTKNWIFWEGIRGRKDYQFKS